MKKIIKTAIVAAMGVLALGMMSCQKDNDEHAILEQTGWGATTQWTVNYENETTNYARGFDVLKTKHTSGKCLISISDSPLSGVVGFVFGKEDNPDGTANFGLVGIQRFNSTTLRYYVSWYKNVDLTKMDGYRNFVGTDGKMPGEAGASCVEYDKTSGWQTISGYTPGADAVIAIKVEAGGSDDNSNGKVEAGEGDGSFVVTLYKGETSVASGTIPNTDTGFTKAKQAALGAYANCYPLKNLLAQICMKDLVQELAEE